MYRVVKREREAQASYMVSCHRFFVLTSVGELIRERACSYATVFSRHFRTRQYGFPVQAVVQLLLLHEARILPIGHQLYESRGAAEKPPIRGAPFAHHSRSAHDHSFPLMLSSRPV